MRLPEEEMEQKWDWLDEVKFHGSLNENEVGLCLWRRNFL